MKHWYYVVLGYFSSPCREAHLKAMEMERASGGQSPYTSFLPEDIVRERINHEEYNRTLLKSGKLMCAGPAIDYSYALFIYIVDNEEEVRSLFEADPFVKCGFFSGYEIKGWYRRF
jgi:uncharacterized protein YciI